jgi:hypothetical protein
MAIRPEGAESHLLDIGIDQYLGIGRRGSDFHTTCGRMPPIRDGFCFHKVLLEGTAWRHQRGPGLLGCKRAPSPY